VENERVFDEDFESSTGRIMDIVFNADLNIQVLMHNMQQ
jgi:hypothetical protein